MLTSFKKIAVQKLVEDGRLSKDYFDSALMSSTYVISNIDNIFHDIHEKSSVHFHEKLEFKFPSDNPTNLTNKADTFESEVLKKFNSSDISSYSQIIERDGKDMLFFALPVRKNTKECLECHGNPKDAPKDMIEIRTDLMRKLEIFAQ